MQIIFQIPLLERRGCEWMWEMFSAVVEWLQLVFVQCFLRFSLVAMFLVGMLEEILCSHCFETLLSTQSYETCKNCALFLLLKTMDLNLMPRTEDLAHPRQSSFTSDLHISTSHVVFLQMIAYLVLQNLEFMLVLSLLAQHQVYSALHAYVFYFSLFTVRNQIVIFSMLNHLFSPNICQQYTQVISPQ